jgi:hypothetical protein
MFIGDSIKTISSDCSVFRICHPYLLRKEQSWFGLARAIAPLQYDKLKMKTIINEHDLQFEAFKGAFEYYCQLRLEAAVAKGENVNEVYLQLKNDLRRYRYTIDKVCGRNVKHTKQAVSRKVKYV